MRRDATDPLEPITDATAAAEPATTGEPAPAATPDPERLAAARAALDEAEARAVAAASTALDAGDDLADAEASVAVLEAKVTATTEDDSTPQWKRLAARKEHDRATRAFAKVGRNYEAAQAAAAEAEEAVDAARAALRKAETTPAADPDHEAPRFASLPVFVEQFVLPNWVHRLGENHAGTWCRRWWEHAEAITRLEATWEAFEVMRTQPPPSLSTWLRDHFDTHMRALCDPAGVFYRCDADQNIHELKPPWSTEAAPEGMFAVDLAAAVQAKTEPDEGEGEQR